MEKEISCFLTYEILFIQGEMVMKFKAEKIVFEDQLGYMLHQYDGKKCIASQFIQERDFEKFLELSGISSQDVVFIQ